MFSRVIRTTAVKSATAFQARFISRSAIRKSGDHGHGAHPMFENIPFKKSVVGPSLAFTVFGLTGVVWGICLFQCNKHGFPVKEE